MTDIVIIKSFLTWFIPHTYFCFQADGRKAKLLDSYDLQRFLSDYRLVNLDLKFVKTSFTNKFNI